MNLDKIILKNFQIHEHLVLEFKSNFTTIVGRNDHGKSSIIRALNWVIYNEPSGDWGRRIDENGKMLECSVKLFFDDETTVERIKGDGTNVYIIDNDKEESFKNFGYSIPEKVLEKLKIYPFVTNKETLNIHIANQEEQPFLIHQPTTVKASVLDILTGNSLIQKAITSFNKENLQNSKTISSLEDEISSDEKILKEMPDINKLEGMYKEIETIENNRIKRCEEMVFLLDSQESLEEHDETINKSKKILKVDVKSIQNLYESKKEKVKEWSFLIASSINLKNYKENIIDIPDMGLVLKSQEKLKQAKQNVSILKEINIRLCDSKKKIVDIPNIKEIVNLQEQYKQKNLDLMSLKSDNSLLESNQGIFLKKCGDMVIFGNQLKKLKEENPTCPVCNKEW